MCDYGTQLRLVDVLSMKQVMACFAKHGYVVFVFMPKVSVIQVMNTQVMGALASRTTILCSLQGQFSDDLPMLCKQVFAIWNIALLLTTIMETLAA